MPEPVAKKNDQVVATDTHIVLVPSAGPPVPTPMPLPFQGVIDDALADDVYAERQLVACHGSSATNTPAHVAPVGSFQTPPSDQAKLLVASGSVYANQRLLARNTDLAETCNDPTDAPVGQVVATGTVFVGG